MNTLGVKHVALESMEKIRPGTRDISGRRVLIDLDEWPVVLIHHISNSQIIKVRRNHHQGALLELRILNRGGQNLREKVLEARIVEFRKALTGNSLVNLRRGGK
jgi:hypothetical protein